jgi:hypothetical protein
MRLLLLVVVLAGCGGTTDDPVVVSDSGVADTAKSDTTVASDTSTADAPKGCFGEGAVVPVVPYKECATRDDCTIARHQTDCCGNAMMIGIAKSQKAAFDACEAASEAAFPACGCPSGPLTIEDGTPFKSDGTLTFNVLCVNVDAGRGECRTKL